MNVSESARGKRVALTSSTEVLSRLREAAGHAVMVVGDVVLDRYVIGRAQRLSREAPVPVLVHESSFSVPGAAANPALNIRALDSRALQVSLIGDDQAGEELLSLLEHAGVETEGIVRVTGRQTTVKQRFLARGSLSFPQQLARVDYLDPDEISESTQKEIAARVAAGAGQADALLLSDYQGGVISDAVLKACLDAQRRHGLPLCVDAQTDLWRFEGASLVKCNREEASRALGRRLSNDDDFTAATAEIRERLGASVVAITRGGDGMSLCGDDGACLHLPAPNRSEVFDVVGAGDTVVAIMALGQAAGWPPALAATVAQLGSGIVIQRLGNATPSYPELEEAAKRWL